MSDVILGAYHGGLGDNLQFSTLPEEFYKQHGRETYLVDGSDFRNKEIYDLVWGMNPYIKGIKEGPRNAGDLPEYTEKKRTGNWIKDWELVHGLEPVNERPKVYYEPKKFDDLAGHFLVDLSSITINHHNTGYGYDLKEVERTYQNIRTRFAKNTFLSIEFNNYVGEINKFNVNSDGISKVSSIFNYCDQLNSVDGIVCFYSGYMVLATAIQRYNPNLKILCITPPSVYNSERTQKKGIFYFDFVEYIVTE